MIVTFVLARSAFVPPEGLQRQQCDVQGQAGLDVVETAQALAISATTVKREWRRGQAWLYRRLQSPAQVGMDVRNAHEMA